MSEKNYLVSHDHDLYFYESCDYKALMKKKGREMGIHV